MLKLWKGKATDIVAELIDAFAILSSDDVVI
jgi:hypothetical protein